MKASDLLNITLQRPKRDEINTLSIDAVFARLREYANDRKFDAPFYGVINAERRKVLEDLGYKVESYETMTEISWR